MLADSALIPWLFGLLGLLIGSFLNVVIHRLPKMMEQQWAADCAQMTDQCHNEPTPTYNLAQPRSACPHCGHLIKWYENLPVISYICLKGQCSACHVRIGWRYPLVELLVGALFGYCAHRWGLGHTAFAWCLFGSYLLAMAAIDWDTTLLPDSMTIPLTWAGLCCAALGWIPISLSSALWGAVAGYLSLWSVYWAFKLITKKEGMGYGDFKLLAALGAWLGWQAIPSVILISSVIGAVIGIGLKLAGRLREGGYMPFGPFLAFAGIVTWLCGADKLLTLFQV
jgi:leader peptidase (prepilin peptidase) / N-methyltransferase